jgi:hypothetical protein
MPVYDAKWANDNRTRAAYTGRAQGGTPYIRGWGTERSLYNTGYRNGTTAQSPSPGRAGDPWGADGGEFGE